jgi:alpha-galactosidase
MRTLFILLFFSAVLAKAQAQTIELNKGWKFKIGDSVAWSSTQYSDKG